MLNLHDGRAPNEATVRVKQLEVVRKRPHFSASCLYCVCILLSSWSGGRSQDGVDSVDTRHRVALCQVSQFIN